VKTVQHRRHNANRAPRRNAKITRRRLLKRKTKSLLRVAEANVITGQSPSGWPFSCPKKSADSMLFFAIFAYSLRSLRLKALKRAISGAL
jgi:hypothetical protein